MDNPPPPDSRQHVVERGQIGVATWISISQKSLKHGEDLSVSPHIAGRSIAFFQRLREFFSHSFLQFAT
jgi:hypothetical protein